MNKPLISIITVSYNAASSIEQTILSVINQTYSNIEYIIIDGGSTDGTIDIIKKYDKKIDFWISEKDKGVYDAMNKGIINAHGKYINFMNTGDTFFNELVISNFVSKANNSATIIYGDTMIYLSKGKFHQKPKDIKLINSQMIFGHQATFILTTYHQDNLYDISYKSSADYNFIYQAYNKGVEFQYIPFIVANYNGAEGISKNIFLSKIEDRKIQKKNVTKVWILSLYIKYFIQKCKDAILYLLPENIVNTIRKIRSQS